MKLSIFIPSYDRNEAVVNSVRRLALQRLEDVELVVLDNASPTPIHDLLAEAGLQGVARVVRHKTNVGAYANILRAFELATAQWLWILGDDDAVTEDAVQTVLSTIEARPHHHYLNFSTAAMARAGLRRTSFGTAGVREFVTRLDYPGNVNFMSVGIWHIPKVVARLNVAYHYAYSMSPTFVLLLSSLGEDGHCHFSEKVLIDEVTTAAITNRWRFKDFILGWNTILELPMDPDVRSMLAAKMYGWHRPENVAVYMLAEAAQRPGQPKYFALARRRLAGYIGFGARMRYWLYSVLFLAPRVSWRVVRRVVQAAVGLRLKGVDVADIEGRASGASDARR